MQVCNHQKEGWNTWCGDFLYPFCNHQKSLKKIIFAIFFVGIFASSLTAQNLEMPAMPEMPSMPDMPSTSASGSFYRPTFPTSSSSKKTRDSATEAKSTTTETLLTDGTTTSDRLTSFLTGDSSTLTASDISSLYDAGLFSDILGLGTTSSSKSSLSGTNGTNGTNALLQEVLTSLNELKDEQKKSSAAEKEILQNTQADSETFKQREPSILRFKINGYNIADSLTKVFFSQPEADGTFLLTADRKYYSNQKAMTETFYMLFETVSSKGTTVSYKVQPAIVQNTKNENSFVYKLMNHHNLTAEKTGNLVVMHLNDDDLTADILLDIDKR